MIPLPVALGRALYRLRSEAKHSQKSLGEVSGVHRTLISSIERGEANVCLSTLERLARGLGITVSELLRYTEQERT